MSSRVLAMLLLGFALSFSAAAQRPNVLFIAIDDLNDWVGPLKGHPQVKTPHMDRLAARGTTFLNAHCQSPLCNPSRTSLLTGLRPSTTGVYALNPWFRESPKLKDWVTLPQHFMQNGYRTYSTGKIWHGGDPPKPDREKEFHVYGHPGGTGVRPPQKLVETPSGNHPLVDWGTFPHKDEEKGDWQVASWAVEKLNTMPKDEPFFLAVGFFLPHVPCHATDKWWNMYPEETLVMPPVRMDDRADTPPFSWYLHWDLPEVRLKWLREVDQWKPLVRAYLATISFMDSQIGRVLDALDANGLADNTVVVLWSDHGWHLGEKLITGKNTLWDRSARVPLIFAGPGVSKNARCERPAELLDLYPTLIDLCGLPKREGLEGHSLAPQLKNPKAPREFPAITTHGPDNHGIRTEQWRYIRYADGSEELYDMRKDPNEWFNLAGDPKHAKTKEQLAKWLPKTSAAPLPGSQPRLVELRDGTVYWEGKPIDPKAKPPGT